MRRAPPVTSALLPCSEPSMSALNSRVNSPHARPPCQRDRSARLDLVRALHAAGAARDRKSTRLNSSHTVISYAVFCLKKKKKKKQQQTKRILKKRYKNKIQQN